MGWHKGNAFRTDPGTGQRIRVNTFKDPVDDNTVVQETLLFAGAPAWFVKIGASEQTNDRDYPYTGGVPAAFAAAASSSATAVKLANGAMDGGAAGSQGTNALNPAGLALVILDGSAKGDVRRITGWNAGAPTATDKTVTLERGISAAITTSDHYLVGHLCEHNTELLVKAEFSSNVPDSMQVLVRYVPLPQTESGAQATPIPVVDKILDILNTKKTFDGGAAYQGSVLSVPCKGGMVATVMVVTKPSVGTADLWIGSI